jgi:molecular chaperone HtpG
LNSTRTSDVTTVKLGDIREGSFFDLTYSQLAYVFRTHSAIGNTLPLWGPDSKPKIDVTLKLINSLGEVEQGNLKYSYWLPIEDLSSRTIIDIEDFKGWTTSSDRTDAEKRAKLRDKIITQKGKETVSGRTLSFYACFVPQRKTWDELNIKSGLAEDENLKNESWLDAHWYTLFRSGIFASVKGMPTGIRIDEPSTGWAGYWENIFVLIEDPNLKFDIGRKSIHGRVIKTHQTCARKIFNEFRNYVTKYVAGDVPPIQSLWDRDEVFAEIEGLPDNDFSCIAFKKSPSDQEATVAAIFYESIGRGYIKDIVPLISGYRGRYDLYANWKQQLSSSPDYQRSARTSRVLKSYSTKSM